MILSNPNHSLNSASQFLQRLEGVIIKTFFANIEPGTGDCLCLSKVQTKVTVCKIFPNSISSPKIPPRPLSQPL